MILFKSIFGKRFVLFLLSNFLFFHFGSFWGNLRAETPEVQSGRQPDRTSQSRQTFHAGDAVQISVFPDTTSFLNDVFPIDGDGRVFLPIVGKTQISNMSEKEFVSFLNNNFTPYLRTPVVQVRPLMRISLLGGFARPNLYYVDANQTLWDVVHRAGGTITENGLKKMKWERGNRIISSNLIDYYQSGRSLNQIGFRTGDQISTPVPSERGFWDSMVRYVLPVATLGISAYTVYLTTQLRSRR